jgi:outer membrane assembly lipoprotein YfiO
MLSILTKSPRSWVVPALLFVLLVGGVAACASTPRFQGRGPTELHAQAQSDFDRRDYGDAIDALDWLLLVYPDYPQAAEARFLMARAYQEDRQHLLAGDEFARFIDRHPLHPLAPDAALGICRSQAALSPIPQRDQTYTRQAAVVCRDVAREYWMHAVAAEAQVLADEMRAKLAQKEYDTGQHYFRRRGYDSAIYYWEMLVEEYWDTPWAPWALLGISQAYDRIGYDDDAEEYRARLLNSYPDSEAAREARGGGISGH